jgi:hypothetical protein
MSVCVIHECSSVSQLVLETHYGHFELWRQRESRISRMNSEDYDTLVAAVGKVVPTAHGEECIVFDPFSEQRLQVSVMITCFRGSSSKLSRGL